jgi:AraC family transcriptional activator of pobA
MDFTLWSICMRKNAQIDVKRNEMSDRLLRAKLLYLQHYEARVGNRVDRHVHPFWQFELVLSGSVACEVDRRRFDLAAGAVLLIAPGIWHGFEYRTPATEFWSVKFEANVARGEQARLTGVMHGQPLVRGALQLLRAALRSETGPGSWPEIGPPGRIGVERALETLMGVGLADAPENAPEEELAARISSLLDERSGEPLAVSEAAQRLGLSRGYLSARFRAAHRVSVKRYIDRERSRFAERLLRYSDLSITEISDQLKFSDPHAFSRFFARLFGQSPRAFRKSHAPRTVGRTR